MFLTLNLVQGILVFSDWHATLYIVQQYCMKRTLTDCCWKLCTVGCAYCIMMMTVMMMVFIYVCIY